MSRTKTPPRKPPPQNPPVQDPDRDEHGHFIRNKMHPDSNRVRPWLMWLGAIGLATGLFALQG